MLPYRPAFIVHSIFLPNLTILREKIFLAGDTMRSFDYSKLHAGTRDSEVPGYAAQIHEHKGRQELFLKRLPENPEGLIETAKIQSTEASDEIERIRTTNTRQDSE